MNCKFNWKSLVRKNWLIFSALTESIMITAILLASVILMVLFDDDPMKDMFLLPEWGAIAFFACLDALKKQLRVIDKQDDKQVSIQVKRTSCINLLQWHILICAVWFVICFMLARGYVEQPSDLALGTIERINIIILIGGLLQNMSASIQLANKTDDDNE